MAVIAGSSASDHRGAQVVNTLKKVAPDTTFFGITGPEMESAGVHPYVKASDLPQKWVYPMANFRVDPRFALSLYMIPENLRLIPTFIRLYRSGFWNNFKGGKKEDVDMIVTVDNDLLGSRVNEFANFAYKDQSALRPLRVHFGLTVRNYTYSHLWNVDYLVYTLPNKSVDKQLFKFPSQFVGVKGVYDVLQFVMESMPNFQGRVCENHLVVDKESFFEMIRQFQVTRKSQYRQKISVASNSWVFFFNPGVISDQIEINAKVIRKAINQMKRKMPDNQQVVVIINLPSKSKVDPSWTEMFKGIEAVVKFIYEDNKKGKLEALAASDFAAIEGSETVFQAAALQIPTVILDNSSNWQGYVTLMHNVYASQINFAMNGELFPEMTLRNFGSKLVEFLEEWIEKPHLKAEVARRFSKQLLTFLPTDDDLKFPHRPEESISRSEIRLYHPEFVTEEFLRNAYAEFRTVKASPLTLAEKQSKRRDLILGPE